MALYVVALTDTPLESWTAGSRTFRTVAVTGLYAVCERRTAVPAATDDELRSQHALVVEIARRVRSILPVRFGALIEKQTLSTILEAHEAEVRAALDAVRDRVQMTLRIVGTRRQPRAVTTSTGREYLEQRRRAVSIQLSRSAASLLASLRPVVALERREAGVGNLLATVYHLVDAADAPRYTRIVTRARTRGAILTGPWPPFAFTPQLW